MNLLELSKARELVPVNHSVLAMGPPKSGKTRLAGTLAQQPEVKNIYWFDIENGIDTLLHMGLTDAELAKITVFKIPDTKDNPIAIETVLKALTSKVAGTICHAHGKWNCAECAKDKTASTPFHLPSLTSGDWVVIDSASALGDSAAAATSLGKDSLYKLTFNDWGDVGKWLADAFSVIQQARYCNFMTLTHEVLVEETSDGKAVSPIDAKVDHSTTKIQRYPLIGSRSFSIKCAKYFSTVMYLHKKMNAHTAGSSSTYRSDVPTGSRQNIAIENAKERTMKVFFEKTRKP